MGQIAKLGFIASIYSQVNSSTFKPIRISKHRNSTSRPVTLVGGLVVIKEGMRNGRHNAVAIVE